MSKTDYFVCSVCGYTAKAQAPERCPICGAIHTKFLKIE
ncbi:MAG: rubredoxin-like domain-containing protein [Candidatus Ranarchaeia archaeon]